MQTDRTETLTFRLWIAGDYDDAKRACREFCADEGACFAVSPACYVYTGGCEDGVMVTLINYPRFPADVDALQDRITRLAAHLCARLFQQSYTIEGPQGTVWHSHREQSA